MKKKILKKEPKIIPAWAWGREVPLVLDNGTVVYISKDKNQLLWWNKLSELEKLQKQVALLRRQFEDADKKVLECAGRGLKDKKEKANKKALALESKLNSKREEVNGVNAELNDFPQQDYMVFKFPMGITQTEMRPSLTMGIKHIKERVGDTDWERINEIEKETRESIHKEFLDKGIAFEQRDELDSDEKFIFITSDKYKKLKKQADKNIMKILRNSEIEKVRIGIKTVEDVMKDSRKDWASITGSQNDRAERNTWIKKRFRELHNEDKTVFDACWQIGQKEIYRMTFGKWKGYPMSPDWIKEIVYTKK